MRLPLGRKGLLAAAALAGAVVSWRVVEQRRSRRIAGEIDDAIDEGRKTAEGLMNGTEKDRPQFDQR